MAERTLDDIIVEQIKRLIIAQINENTEEKHSKKSIFTNELM